MLTENTSELHIGSIVELSIEESLPTGYWLSVSSEQRLFLPIENCPQDITDKVKVFITVDKNGQKIADAQLPKSELDKVTILTAKDATDSGAFFDWGTSRDLYVPQKWQEFPVNPGMDYLVVPFVDEKSQRIVGCTKLKHFYPETNEWLKPKQTVSLQVFAKTDLGYKMLIDETTLGLLFHSDVHVALRIGDKLQGSIKEIRDDGKINLSIGPQSKDTRKSLAQAILDDLEAHDGLSTLTDKSSPEEIYEHFKVSKAAYKKALGNLFRNKKILLEKGIVKLNK